KYDGSDSALPIPLASADLTSAFEVEHKKRFGFVDPTRAIIVASLSAEATVQNQYGPLASRRLAPAQAGETPAVHGAVSLRAGGANYQAPVFVRKNLMPGFETSGPALIIEQGATTFVDIGWHARMNEHDDIVLTRTEKIERAAIGTRADPILLEVFNNRFMAVAEEM